MKTEAVVFDLDGTLLSTFDDIVYTINSMLKRLNYRTLDRERIRKLIGFGTEKFLKGALPEFATDSIDNLLPIYNEIYDSIKKPKTKLFDGVPKMLTTLSKKEIKLFVLSNKPYDSIINTCMNLLEIYNFTEYIGSKDGILPKPDPKALLDLISRNNLNKDSVLMVGDGDADIKTALNADIMSVACLWGYRTKEELKAAGAVNFATTPLDVINYIKW